MACFSFLVLALISTGGETRTPLAAAGHLIIEMQPRSRERQAAAYHGVALWQEASSCFTQTCQDSSLKCFVKIRSEMKSFSHCFSNAAVEMSPEGGTKNYPNAVRVQKCKGCRHAPLAAVWISQSFTS